MVVGKRANEMNRSLRWNRGCELRVPWEVGCVAYNSGTAFAR
jgi:hypothetical protein